VLPDVLVSVDPRRHVGAGDVVAAQLDDLEQVVDLLAVELVVVDQVVRRAARLREVAVDDLLVAEVVERAQRRARPERAVLRRRARDLDRDAAGTVADELPGALDQVEVGVTALVVLTVSRVIGFMCPHIVRVHAPIVNYDRCG